MPHGRPSVGAVPGVVHLTHVGDELLHLTCTEGGSDHHLGVRRKGRVWAVKASSEALGSLRPDKTLPEVSPRGPTFSAHQALLLSSHPHSLGSGGTASCLLRSHVTSLLSSHPGNQSGPKCHSSLSRQQGVLLYTLVFWCLCACSLIPKHVEAKVD